LVEKNLDPRKFKIPIDRIRAGYYSDKYFTRFGEVLRKSNYKPNVLYQFFPRKDACIVGVHEAVAILRTCTGYYKDADKAEALFKKMLQAEYNLQSAVYDLERKEMEMASRKKWDIRDQLNALWVDKWNDIYVKTLNDGDMAKDKEIIMTIEGDPNYFGYLETVLLGVISRASSTATATEKVVRAANGKPILFFSARFDHHWVQATDGYAALKAGALGVSTDANADYWGTESLGTIPHSLIAAMGGDTIKAAEEFDRHISEDVNRMVLVDWDNDVIGTSKSVLKDMYEKKYNKVYVECESDLKKLIGEGKGKIYAVRFDTSGTLRDKSVIPQDSNSLGVCPEQVWRARKEFDRIGANDLRIVVSGGFNADRINLFETLKVPVDMYGVGSSLLKQKIDFTADIVKVNGKPCAKVGRGIGDHSRLEKIHMI
jgi:nicotinate phosphoribosyltransferase